MTLNLSGGDLVVSGTTDAPAGTQVNLANGVLNATVQVGTANSLLLDTRL